MKPFDLLPSYIQEVLVKLEEQDTKERAAGAHISKRLRQIPRETGEYLYSFLTSLIAKPSFVGLEIGGSGGYSGIWQGAACQAKRMGKLYSIENDTRKNEIARENVKNARLEQHLELINADAKRYISDFTGKFDYIFLDAEKEDYSTYYRLLDRKVHPGTVLIADNVISHANDMEDFLKAITRDPMVITYILPVGKGLAIVTWR